MGTCTAVKRDTCAHFDGDKERLARTTNFAFDLVPLDYGISINSI